MSQSKKKRNHPPRAIYRPIAIAALMTSGVLQPLLLPVLAAGTGAGTSISNTATATYADDNNNPYNATSNTVNIVVAPVSGLTVQSTGITDVNGGSVQSGDLLQYNFTVANIGNTPSDIYIPGTSQVITSNFTATKVEVSTDGGATFKDLSTFTNGIVPAVAADATIQVRVTGNVASTGVTAGQPITVTLGNTGLNDNLADTQNIVVTSTDPTALGKKVRTNFTIGQNTPPNNKEASATQSVNFNTAATNQAFPLLKKTVTDNPGATAAGNDDILTYNLNFSVLNTSPNGNYTPANLVGTNVKVDGTTSAQILVSDAVPAGTVLNAAPVAPTGWKTVYSTDPVATTIAVVSTSPTALTAASWTSTTPTNLSTVTRVGFIYTGGTSISPTAPAVNFPISVITSGLPVNGGKVDNIAQVFGQTAGDTTNTIVMDQSGDANAANFSANGTPAAFDPSQDTGKANPATQGVDPGNNTGTGPKGADTEITITGTVAAATGTLLNGPNGQPTAVGPTNSNDDFTNASTPVPAGLAPTALIPNTALATFTNTVKNASSTVVLAEVTVQPIAPSQANTANGDSYGTDSSIPSGTLVTLTNPANGQSATYLYAISGGGVGSFTLQNPYNASSNPTGSKPIDFGALATGATANYTVQVTLPANSVTPLTAVSIPMIAFPASAAGSGYLGTESTTNVSIDRVYTGYMQLTKQARILSSTGTVIQDWTATPTTQVQPGQFIEYRILYQNISSIPNGSGNVVLNANNFTLTEDGTTLPNNWAATTTHQQNTVGTGTLTFFNSSGATIGSTDPANGTDVGKYQTVIPQVTPNAQGTFQFRRLVK